MPKYSNTARETGDEFRQFEYDGYTYTQHEPSYFTKEGPLGSEDIDEDEFTDASNKAQSMAELDSDVEDTHTFWGQQGLKQIQIGKLRDRYPKYVKQGVDGYILHTGRDEFAHYHSSFTRDENEAMLYVSYALADKIAQRRSDTFQVEYVTVLPNGLQFNRIQEDQEYKDELDDTLKRDTGSGLEDREVTQDDPGRYDLERELDTDNAGEIYKQEAGDNTQEQLGIKDQEPTERDGNKEIYDTDDAKIIYDPDKEEYYYNLKERVVSKQHANVTGDYEDKRSQIFNYGTEFKDDIIDNFTAQAIANIGIQESVFDIYYKLINISDISEAAITYNRRYIYFRYKEDVFKAEVLDSAHDVYQIITVEHVRHESTAKFKGILEQQLKDLISQGLDTVDIAQAQLAANEAGYYELVDYLNTEQGRRDYLDYMTLPHKYSLPARESMRRARQMQYEDTQRKYDRDRRRRYLGK